MAFLDISGRRGLWSCEGSMPQCRGTSGQGSGNEWVSEQGEGDGIGSFLRGNQERGYPQVSQGIPPPQRLSQTFHIPHRSGTAKQSVHSLPHHSPQNCGTCGQTKRPENGQRTTSRNRRPVTAPEPLSHHLGVNRGNRPRPSTCTQAAVV